MKKILIALVMGLVLSGCATKVYTGTPLEIACQKQADAKTDKSIGFYYGVEWTYNYNNCIKAG